MRKIALKRKYPNRHKIIEILREKNHLKEIMDYNGKSIFLNITKHILYQRPYFNDYYQKELLRFSRHGGI